MEEFTIYYGILPDGRRKIGVDCNYPNRIRGQNLTDYRILEVHTDVYEVSDRELELQRENGLEVDTIPYYKVYFKNKSPEFRAKVSNGLIGNTNGVGNKSRTGQTNSKETRSKIGAANTGKVHTEETKNKIGAALTGRDFSEEHKAKLSVKAKGKFVSEETKDRISAAQKGKPLPRIDCKICGNSIPPSHMDRHLNRKNTCQPK